MSTPREPRPGVFVLSILSARWDEFWPGLLHRLTDHFGPVALDSGLIPFDVTTYYEPEFGAPLFRRLLSFERPLPLDALAGVKVATNEMERASAAPDGRRLVNLDPGYVTLERLVLASGKNFTHRVYLGQRIWADLTLIYQGGDWVSLPWTFRDYASAPVQAFLTRVRDGYHREILEEAGNKL
jgi:hypothetical protein